MKSLNVNGRVLKYEVEFDFLDQTMTVFYEGVNIRRYRKFFTFGPIIEKHVPREIFTLYFDIESPRYTKREIRNNILKQLALIDRMAQIARGEII